MDRQREAIKLQKEGNFLDALSLLEQELLLTQQQYGENSPAFHKLGDKVAELCNQLAMNCLVNEKMSQALDLLKRAQILSAKTPHLKAITYNNIACFYRRQGKLRVAMNYLHKALAIDTSPDIYLNLCAVLSQSGKHDLALEQAMHAVILLQETLMNASPSQHKEVYALKAPVLAIAYHNLAVELEHMKRLPESLRYYTKAVEFARKHLPDDHTVMTALLEAQISANRQAKTRSSKGRKMPPIRGNYRIVFKEGKDARDGKGSPSPFLRGQAGRHARSKSPDFGGRLHSISPMRNNFFEQTGAYTERLRTEEVMHTEADMRQITSEYSNPSTPKRLQPIDKNSKSASQPLRNLRRSQLAELRHSIQTAEDVVHISSASRPMLEISSGKVIAIQVNQNKTSAVFSAETLSIEPIRRSSDSEPSAVSRKKNYTRDALDIINQFGISINSQEPSGKVAQLLSDGAAKPGSRKASNPNIGNPTLEQRLSLKERIASLKSLNSSNNPSVKTDRSIKLPPLPSEDADPANTSGKAPSQISRVSLDASQGSVKVFKRSIRRSNRNSTSNTPSNIETTDLKVFEARRESYRYKDIESRDEEDICNVEDVGKRRGDEEENVEEDEIEKRDGVGSMRMNINYDDTKLVRKESVFELEIGKESGGVSVSSEEFEPDQFVADTEMSLEQGKEVIIEQAEQEDIDMSHEPEEINQDKDISSEKEDIEISSEKEDIEISSEKEDIEISSEKEDIEISSEKEDIEISSEKEDIEISSEIQNTEITPKPFEPETQQMDSIEIERETEEQGIPQDEDNQTETNASIHIESTLSQADEVQPEEPIPDTELITSSPQDPEEVHSPSNLSLQDKLDINEHEVSSHEEAMIEPDPVQASSDEAVAMLEYSNNVEQASIINEGLTDSQGEDENATAIHEEGVEQDLAQIQQEEEKNVSIHEESLVLPDESKVVTSIHDEIAVGDQVNLSNHEEAVQVKPEEALITQEPAETEVQNQEDLDIEELAEVETEVQPEEAIIPQEPVEAEVETEVQPEEAIITQEPVEAEVETEVQPEEAIIPQEPVEAEVEIVAQPEEANEPAEATVQHEESIIPQEPVEIAVQQEEAIIPQEPVEAEAEIEVQQEVAEITKEPVEIESQPEETIPIQEPAESEVIVQQEEALITQEPAETEIKVQQEEAIEIQEQVESEVIVQHEEAIEIQEPAEAEVQKEEALITQEPDKVEVQQESSAVNEIEQEDQKEPQIDPSPNLALSPADLPEDSTQQPEIHPHLSSPSSSLPHAQEIACEESSSPQDTLQLPQESAPQPSDLQDLSPLPTSSPKSESSKLVDPEEPAQPILPA